MKLIFSELTKLPVEHGAELAEIVKTKLAPVIEKYSDDFVQDLSHISQAANYSGDLQVDQVEYLKDNLYRCDYSYNWEIAWTCSGTQEAGRVNEKVRFTVDENGELNFKFLKLEL